MAIRIEFRRLRIFRRLREMEEQMDTQDKRLQRLELRAMEEDCRIRQVMRSNDPADTEDRPAEQPQEQDDSTKHTQHTQQELREWLLFRDEYPKEGDV